MVFHLFFAFFAEGAVLSCIMILRLRVKILDGELHDLNESERMNDWIFCTELELRMNTAFFGAV